MLVGLISLKTCRFRKLQALLILVLISGWPDVEFLVFCVADADLIRGVFYVNLMMFIRAYFNKIWNFL